MYNECDLTKSLEWAKLEFELDYLAKSKQPIYQRKASICNAFNHYLDVITHTQTLNKMTQQMNTAKQQHHCILTTQRKRSMQIDIQQILPSYSTRLKSLPGEFGVFAILHGALSMNYYHRADSALSMSYRIVKLSLSSSHIYRKNEIDVYQASDNNVVDMQGLTNSCVLVSVYLKRETKQPQNTNYAPITPYNQNQHSFFARCYAA